MLVIVSGVFQQQRGLEAHRERCMRLDMKHQQGRTYASPAGLRAVAASKTGVFRSSAACALMSQNLNKP